jgi:hypothetical protein
VPLPQLTGGGEQGAQRRADPDPPGHLPRAPEPDPRCADDYDEIGGNLLGTGVGTETKARVANFEYQRKCPNAQNLIAIIGDSADPDRVCDVKCDIQIEGMGRRARTSSSQVSARSST